MDDEVFRSAKANLQAPVCVYEKAIQHGHFVCQYAQAVQMGERQALSCPKAAAYARCQSFLSETFAVSGFAIGRAAMPAHLPFAQAMKVQVGGLQGLAGLLSVTKNADQLLDIAGLLQQAAQVDALNYSALMPAVAAFEVPRRRRASSHHPAPRK